jgi:2-(1,2-epoxy-1,2-dihydrophenyl)acetyl-CoA isomerase
MGSLNMTFEDLSLEAIQFVVDDGVATITRARPASRNAINPTMREELGAVTRLIQQDPVIKAVVLTGAGETFSAGGDLNGMSDIDAGAMRQRLSSAHAYLTELINLDRPVIAAVDGVAFGAGFSLALTADIVVASTRARFCMAFMRVGLVPDYGAFHTLPRVVGLQRAKELIYSAREVSAEEALSLGIALEIHPPQALLPRALAIAHSMKHASSTAFGLAKRALNQSYESSLQTMLNLEAAAQSVAIVTPEYTAARARFVTKQKPVYEWPRRE